jgi:hypothetical protein
MKKIIKSAAVLCFSSVLFGDVKSMPAIGNANANAGIDPLVRPFALIALTPEDLAEIGLTPDEEENVGEEDEDWARNLLAWGANREEVEEQNIGEEEEDRAEVGEQDIGEEDRGNLLTGRDENPYAGFEERTTPAEELPRGQFRGEPLNQDLLDDGSYAPMQEQSFGSRFVNFWSGVREGIGNFLGRIADFFRGNQA